MSCPSLKNACLGDIRTALLGSPSAKLPLDFSYQGPISLPPSGGRHLEGSFNCKVLSSAEAGEGRKHRVFLSCPCCEAWIPSGRMAQHTGTENARRAQEWKRARTLAKALGIRKDAARDILHRDDPRSLWACLDCHLWHANREANSDKIQGIMEYAFAALEGELADNTAPPNGFGHLTWSRRECEICGNPEHGPRFRMALFPALVGIKPETRALAAHVRALDEDLAYSDKFDRFLSLWTWEKTPLEAAMLAIFQARAKFYRGDLLADFEHAGLSTGGRPCRAEDRLLYWLPNHCGSHLATLEGMKTLDFSEKKERMGFFRLTNMGPVPVDKQGHEISRPEPCDECSGTIWPEQAHAEQCSGFEEGRG